MTELQNDRMTDRTKTIFPPIFDLGGIKTKLCLCGWLALEGLQLINSYMS